MKGQSTSYLAMVLWRFAVTQSFAQRFPKKRAKGGRAPIPLRVLLALELLKDELGESDEGICQRLRTDVAVMYACGLREIQADGSQAHFVLPETLAQFRRRINQELMDKLVALQGAAAMEEGLVSPAHLLVDKVGPTPDTTFPSEQGSQRVTEGVIAAKTTLHLWRLSATTRVDRLCEARNSPWMPSPSASRRAATAFMVVTSWDTSNHWFSHRYARTSSSEIED